MLSIFASNSTAGVSLSAAGIITTSMSDSLRQSRVANDPYIVTATPRVASRLSDISRMSSSKYSLLSLF